MIYIMRTNLTVRASLLTLILAFFAIGTFALTKVVMKKEAVSVKQTPTTFFYNGPSTNLSVDIMNPAYWGTAQAAGLECGHPTEIPCSLPVEAGKTISQKLTELNNLAGVQANTSTRRNESF